jgi:hypothetical protein
MRQGSEPGYGRDPVRIYVLWHPDFAEGAAYAGSVFRWFRGDPGNLAETGNGIPVLYRSAPGSADGSAPRPIDTGRADVNVLVPLVDENMVVEPLWRCYLQAIVDGADNCFLAPVAVHKAAYHLPAGIDRLNFLRVDRPTDPGSWTGEHRYQVRQQRLLSLLTQVVGRLLTGVQSGGPAPGDVDWKEAPAPPVRVFVSHAKADGVPVAEELCAAILSHGQLEVFFDESDLAIGYRYTQDLVEGAAAARSGARTDTTAMLSVYTNAYARRPWCRRELRLARTPVMLEPARDRATCWRTKPLLIVEALQRGDTYFLSEAGQVPVVDWSEGEAPAIVDRLLREVLLFAYQEARARTLPAAPGRHALNCVPDLFIALTIVREAEKSGEVAKELLVPPPGPSGVDRRAIEELIPGLSIKTFDELGGDNP